ncbi:hypothetical protein [Francisella uliginis]|uniref:Uncharacterized protein n=1 Tax=Francisella uliginis TaxID=573570 RepID=A0A1L4BT64_9GAMM|nr:hypothetical protein [Francisella uliginis]API87017.1 hypothetical protein F7310_06445 [Francisella uliginis]
MQFIIGLVSLALIILWYIGLYILNNKYIIDLTIKNNANKLLIFSSITMILYTLGILILLLVADQAIVQNIRASTFIGVTIISAIPFVVLPTLWRRFADNISIRVFFWLSLVHVVISDLIIILSQANLSPISSLIISLIAFLILIVFIVMLSTKIKQTTENKPLLNKLVINIGAIFISIIFIIGAIIASYASNMYESGNYSTYQTILLSNIGHCFIDVASIVTLYFIMSLLAYRYRVIRGTIIIAILMILVGVVTVGAFTAISTYYANLSTKDYLMMISSVYKLRYVVEFFIYSAFFVMLLKQNNLRIIIISISFLTILILPVFYKEYSLGCTYTLFFAILFLFTKDKYLNK